MRLGRLHGHARQGLSQLAHDFPVAHPSTAHQQTRGRGSVGAHMAGSRLHRIGSQRGLHIDCSDAGLQGQLLL